MVAVNVFIQARMSSARFPGKVLAPLLHKPLVQHLIDRVREAEGVDKIVVLTSVESSDDPLVAYLEKTGCAVYRGELENVYERFQGALNAYPCDYFVRLSADSPLMDSELLSDVIAYTKQGSYDFISNVKSQMFPKGQSVEIMRSDKFRSVDAVSLTPEQQEHVMPYFYEAQGIKTLFIDNKINQRHINMCVDTIEDLRNIESGIISFEYQGCVHGR